MGKRDEVRRRTYAEILETADLLAEREGWRAVTIRRIATEIGYSAPVIYQHFPSKEAVLHTLLVRGNGELTHCMLAAVARGPASRTPHLAAAAYLEFARSRPSLYQLISGAPGTDIDASTRRAAAADVITFTRQLIGEWAAATACEPPDTQDACDLLWATLHGLAGIATIEDIGFDRASRLADQAVTALLAHWSARPTHPEKRSHTVRGET
ncbi:TetR family transcriptional regulator [Streptomyces sp. CB01201]|uniref:TetR/AcrR family transcriptional regulator n=1 Tax=Streptomyces sp. CB01201 TaxID=2020324 RepID=UPI000C270664|nr:TetR/AcrR family transcriptional regulator [Streptomyces sp. CB01201]PJM97888.1 TetR family transcriptional regulator [Streptomyces sp. CB01201]